MERQPPGGHRDSAGPRPAESRPPLRVRVYTKSPPHRTPRVDAARKMGIMAKIVAASTHRMPCNAFFLSTRQAVYPPFGDEEKCVYLHTDKS